MPSPSHRKVGTFGAPGLVSALICTVDGAVVSALVDDRQDPRTVARATVIDVIDAVAPFDRRPVQI